VQDLAAGHVLSLGHLARNPGVTALNLGMGVGHSVREVLTASSARAGGRFRASMRRAGRATSPASTPIRGARNALLGWRATHGLDAICADAWRWQQAGGRY
jgi:UDP-glucose 4-epimerase